MVRTHSVTVNIDTKYGAQFWEMAQSYARKHKDAVSLDHAPEEELTGALADIDQGFKELKLHREGKIQCQTLTEVLNEL